MGINAEQAWKVYETADRLYTLEEVEASIDHMAKAISGDLAGSDPVVLCVMNGGFIPGARLSTRMAFPHWLDYIHATRYREQTTGSDLRWLKRPGVPLHGRSVLVVDDILDEGITLAEIVDFCEAEGAAEVASAVLCRKLHDRSNGFHVDYLGLDVEDRYVFGYGMDYKGYLRNAPGIFAVSDKA